MKAGFNLIGISVRTTNKDNQASKDLGALWQQFFVDSLLEKIPNKISTNILCVYTDYESDFTGEYTAMIGVPAKDLSEIPDGLVGREFPAANFKIFTAEGEMPNAVVNTWNGIWTNDKNLSREYTYDFEVYGADSQKGEDSKVDIYISVKAES
ncbi:putative transcriptional regulator YdeE [Pedobacter sp. UYEF25]